MTWLKQNWFKIGMLLISLVIVAAYYENVQSKKAEDTAARLTREAESKREYIAKRKGDCLDIYKVEIGKWHNVNGWRYEEKTDRCYVAYKESSPKSEAQCEKDFEKSRAIFPPNSLPISISVDYFNCRDGIFEKDF